MLRLWGIVIICTLFAVGCTTIRYDRTTNKVLYRDTLIPKMLVPPRLEVIVVADDKTATAECEKLGITRPWGVGGCYYAFNPEQTATFITSTEWWKVLHEMLHMLGYKEEEIPDILQPWGER